MAGFRWIIAVAALGIAHGCSAGTETKDPVAEAGQSAPLPDTSWVLDSEASRISFVSIKAGEAIETHYFPGLSGTVSPDGGARVEIPLDEVETKVDIRNERMREMFFETGKFPLAEIRTNVEPNAFAGLEVGERARMPVKGMLSLHGAEAPVEVDAFVTRIAPARVEVESVEPVVVYLSDFDLEPGLERLRDIAGLPSITASSPVTFTFVFDAQTTNAVGAS